MATTEVCCPSCGMKGSYPFKEDGQYVIQPCVSCGEPLCIHVKVNTKVLTTSTLAQMAIGEILDATTAIGAFLDETGEQKQVLGSVDSWKHASRAVDKLEAFAEKIRAIAKP
jgi:hypothetical protein